MKLKILFVLFLLSNGNLNSQNNWFGYGIGFSYLELTDEFVTFRTHNMFSEKTNKYITFKSGEIILYTSPGDENEYEPRKSIRFLNDGKDSLELKISDLKYKFYKDPVDLHLDEINFYHFIYELLAPWKVTRTRIELSAYGILRETDHTNKTLFEIEVSPEELNNFILEFNKLDLKNIHLADRHPNICDDDEYSLTFIDKNKIRYTYTSIYLTRNLQPILNIVEKMLSDNKEK